MIFGNTINNGLLQVAVSSGEATIRHACGGTATDIHAELDQFGDGRDAIHIYVRGADWDTEFTLLLRNYFIRPVLWRVARRAWQKRAAVDFANPRIRDFDLATWHAERN